MHRKIRVPEASLAGDFRVGFQKIFGRTWPQDPSRSPGLALQFNFHEKYAPQTLRPFGDELDLTNSKSRQTAFRHPGEDAVSSSVMASPHEQPEAKDLPEAKDGVHELQQTTCKFICQWGPLCPCRKISRRRWWRFTQKRPITRRNRAAVFGFSLDIQQAKTAHIEPSTSQKTMLHWLPWWRQPHRKFRLCLCSRRPSLKSMSFSATACLEPLQHTKRHGGR